MSERKATVASNRMILFVGCMIVAMLSVPFVSRVIVPMLESSEQAQALSISYYTSSSINALSGIEQGYISKSLENPMDVEVYLKEGIKCALVPFTKDCGWYAKVYYDNGKKDKEARIIGNAEPIKTQSLSRIFITKKFGDPKVEVSGQATDFCTQPTIEEIDAYAQEASLKFSVDKKLILAVIKQESGFDHCGSVSRKGAMGLMQLLPSTARGLTDEELNCDNFMDPRINVLCGTKYLKQHLQAFNDRDLALAAYNAGPSRVREYGGIPPFPETREYIELVTKYQEQCCTNICTADIFWRCSLA
jgi:hypothetical protein